MQRVKNKWFIYTVFLLLLVSGVLAWGILQKTRLDRSSRAVVSETIDAVLNNSEHQVLIDSALNDQLNDKPASRYAGELTATKTTLGPLNEILGIYGEAKVPLVNLFALPIIANYEVDLSFAAGPATLQITMQRHNGEWLTSRFLISSRQLMN